jgi:hypothetical protein
VITLGGWRYFRYGVSFRIRINYMSRDDIDDYMIDREMMHMHDIYADMYSKILYVYI